MIRSTSDHGGRTSEGDHSVEATVAICDLVDGDLGASGAIGRFAVSEYVLLRNGDLLRLRSGLGWTVGPAGADARPSTDELVEDTLLTVLPSEDADPDDPDPDLHPWELLARLARGRGQPVDAAELSERPYVVLLSDAAVRWSTKSNPPSTQE